MKKNNKDLKWSCIYYREERDTDGSVISIDSIAEAPYRNGFLVEHTHTDYKIDREIRSLTFAPIN